MEFIYQPDERGCFSACCATLFGGTYEEWEPVAHHHSDWEKQLHGKTGLSVLEVIVRDDTCFNVSEGEYCMLGIIGEPHGHVVIGQVISSKLNENIQVKIIHDPLGEVKPFYKFNTVLFFVKRFMP